MHAINNQRLAENFEVLEIFPKYALPDSAYYPICSTCVTTSLSCGPYSKYSGQLIETSCSHCQKLINLKIDKYICLSTDAVKAHGLDDNFICQECYFDQNIKYICAGCGEKETEEEMNTIEAGLFLRTFTNPKFTLKHSSYYLICDNCADILDEQDEPITGEIEWERCHTKQ
jgi:hypothetical protein